ncbi:conserved hypothetical protein [Cupriavidus necator H16]|uniref:Uncharacterized protein n=1 Tax=Cupriavidus necator (strain ATCC 17699 / DSM 428 / KCTC 22496 / NCIMB 10442 / H16 / Stanier 337) TaxID=381666 RepID=Q0KFQ6_CUPNH|nr:conserved hypothetical protein [Cupriavidus necator H16]
MRDNNHVSLRVLGRSMISIQAAADRAYLDIKYGNIWKHARLPIAFYDDADFIVGDPEKGSYIIKFLSEQGEAIVKRLRQAIADPYRSAIEGGEQEIFSIKRQIEARKNQVDNVILVPQTFDEFLQAPDELATRAYGDKSINKNIDHMLSPVRKDPDAILKISLKPNYRERTETFTFTQKEAIAFKKVVSQRQLGNPVIYHGRLRALDRGHNQKANFKGKFINAANDRDLALFIQSEQDYSDLVPYMDRENLTIVACPIVEYDSFDPVAGDIQFVKILTDG